MLGTCNEMAYYSEDSRGGRTRGGLAAACCFVVLFLAFILATTDLNLVPSASAQDSLSPRTPVRQPSRIPVPPVQVFRSAVLVYRQTEGEGFRKPAGVFVERETGEILVADMDRNLVTLFSRDGVPLFSFGYNGEVKQPIRAVADKLGRIIVLSGVPKKVRVFSYRGEPLGDFPFPGFEGAEQAVPTALTIDDAGHMYIADATSGQILVYDPEWRLRLRFGGHSQGPGGLRSVTAITVDAAGRILVADAQHTPAIQVFDAGGTYLRGWGEHTAGPMGVSLPSGIAVDTTGRILVADTIRQTITVFGPEGEFLFRFGGLGTGPGSLGYPGGLDADHAGRLYVTEAGNARLQIFEMVAAAGSGQRQRMPTTPPAREREEIRRGLGQILQGIGK